MSLFENGKVKKFEMKDRCAAGAGKFLETMAKGPCMRKLLVGKLGRSVLTPEEPRLPAKQDEIVA